MVAPENCFQQYLIGISSTSDGLSGYFSFNNQAYLLRPAGLGRSVIYEFIPPLQMTESCSACDNSGSSSSSSPLVTSIGNHGEFSSGVLSVKDVGKSRFNKILGVEGGACVIDLAVGFTPEAADFLDIKAEAAAIVAQMNHALVCSKVTNFCYRLAGCDRLDFLEDRGTQFNVSDILDQITPPSPTLPDIIAFRSDNNADQVLIVKADNLEPGFGISQVQTTPSDRWRSVVIDGSIARFTPSHELAHNHGCQHLEDAITGGDGELNIWARSHLVNATSTTIMSQSFQLPSGQTRTFNFSNPDQFNWLWEPTGLSDRDNAQQLRSTGCDIADLVDSFNPEWSQTLRIRPMDPNTCPGDNTSFTVTDRCLNSTIGTVSWSWSINGSAYQHLQTTSNGTISLTLPQLIGYNYIDIKAVAYCTDGEMVSDIYRTSVSACHDPCSEDEVALQSNLEDEVESYNTLKAFNIDDQRTLVFLDESQEVREIYFTDLLGRVQKADFKLTDKGVMILNIDAHKSLRFVAIVTSKGTQTFILTN